MEEKEKNLNDDLIDISEVEVSAEENPDEVIGFDEKAKEKVEKTEENTAQDVEFSADELEVQAEETPEETPEKVEITDVETPVQEEFYNYEEQEVHEEHEKEPEKGINKQEEIQVENLEPEGEEHPKEGENNPENPPKKGKENGDKTGGIKEKLKNKKVLAITGGSFAGVVVLLAVAGFLLSGKEKPQPSLAPVTVHKRPAFVTAQLKNSPAKPSKKQGENREKENSLNSLARQALKNSEVKTAKPTVQTIQIARNENAVGSAVKNSVNQPQQVVKVSAQPNTQPKVPQNQAQKVQEETTKQPATRESLISVAVGIDKNIALLKKELELKKLKVQEKETDLKLKELESKEKQLMAVLSPPSNPSQEELERVKSALSQIKLQVETLKEQVRKRQTSTPVKPPTVVQPIDENFPLKVVAVSCKNSCRALVSFMGQMKVVKEGDRIGGVLVSEITPDGILLKNGNQKVFVGLSTL